MMELDIKLNGSLRIGNDTEIEIVVKGIVGDAVRFAIGAPPHIAIDREEVRRRKQQDRGSRRSAF